MKTTQKSPQAWRGHEGALRVLMDVFSDSEGRHGVDADRRQKKTAIVAVRGRLS